MGWNGSLAILERAQKDPTRTQIFTGFAHRFLRFLKDLWNRWESVSKQDSPESRWPSSGVYLFLERLTNEVGYGIRKTHQEKATMETSRFGVPLQRARGRWEPGAGVGPKIPPEPPTEQCRAGFRPQASSRLGRSRPPLSGRGDQGSPAERSRWPGARRVVPRERKLPSLRGRELFFQATSTTQPQWSGRCWS